MASQNLEQKEKIFIAGLILTESAESYKSYFSQLGNIDVLTIRRRKPNDPTHLGKGYLQTDSSTAQKILNACPHIYKGRRIDVKPFIGGNKLKRQRLVYQKRRIYVHGLPDTCSDKELAKYFKKFGQVENCYTLINKEKTNQKVGFVLFKQAKVAEEILKIKKMKFQGRKLEFKRIQNILVKHTKRQKKHKYQFEVNKDQTNNQNREKNHNFWMRSNFYPPISNWGNQAQNHVFGDETNEINFNSTYFAEWQLARDKENSTRRLTPPREKHDLDGFNRENLTLAQYQMIRMYTKMITLHSKFEGSTEESPDPSLHRSKLANITSVDLSHRHIPQNLRFNFSHIGN